MRPKDVSKTSSLASLPRFADVPLYRRMAELPPQLQMFMDGCPPELEAKRHRIACRQIVMRNLLLLAAGVRRTICGNLAPEVPSFSDPYQMGPQR